MPKLFVISGPSGSGKDAIIDGLAEVGIKVARVITTTSRPMRSNESEGRPYHFLSPAEFDRQKNNGEFLESAYYNGFGYGSRQSDLAEATSTGLPVIWRVDPQGVKSIKNLYRDSKNPAAGRGDEGACNVVGGADTSRFATRPDTPRLAAGSSSYPDAVFILISASAEEIKNRLRARGANTDEQIANRMKEYDAIMAEADMYNVVIQNHDGHLAGAVGELAKIMSNE